MATCHRAVSRSSAGVGLRTCSQRPGVMWPTTAGLTGCQAELTEAHARGEPWWSVGLEAAGSAGLLRDALQHAVDLVFARPLPAGAGRSLDDSRSRAQWPRAARAQVGLPMLCRVTG
jgi:hypothetical protein